MRAYRLENFKRIDSLTIHDEAPPEPNKDEVLVKVHSVALNFRDIAPILGRYVWNARPGLIPCSDAAGEVVAVGDGVKAFRPGDRVISTFHPRWFGGRPPRTMGAETYGSGQDGWLAEYKVVCKRHDDPLVRELT